MLEIKNTEVFGLERAIKASGNPMTVGEINTTNIGELDSHMNRAKKLGGVDRGTGHDNFLKGIQVTVDIKYPQYWTPEAQRYNFFFILSSQSKMHRLTAMGKNDNFISMFNKYVDQDVIEIVKKYIELYNYYDSSKLVDGYYYTPQEEKFSVKEFNDIKYACFMRCVSNLPLGFEMWETVQFSYLQLKTIYFQRRNHKLKEDWGAFCDWCETLPMFKELIGINN